MKRLKRTLWVGAWGLAICGALVVLIETADHLWHSPRGMAFQVWWERNVGDSAQVLQMLEAPTEKLPPIRDTQSMFIESKGCFGSCPRFRLRVLADGGLQFEGDYLTCQAAARAQLPALQVQRLFAAADWLAPRWRDSRIVTRLSDAWAVRLEWQSEGVRRGVWLMPSEEVAVSRLFDSLWNAAGNALPTRGGCAYCADGRSGWTLHPQLSEVMDPSQCRPPGLASNPTE